MPDKISIRSLHQSILRQLTVQTQQLSSTQVVELCRAEFTLPQHVQGVGSEELATARSADRHRRCRSRSRFHATMVGSWFTVPVRLVGRRRPKAARCQQYVCQNVDFRTSRCAPAPRPPEIPKSSYNRRGH